MYTFEAYKFNLQSNAPNFIDRSPFETILYTYRYTYNTYVCIYIDGKILPQR